MMIYNNPTAVGLTLQNVYVHNVCHYCPYDVTNTQDNFWSCTVDVHIHAFNCNNNKPTLLKVYKPALWTSMLCTMLAICTRNFGCVQLMYMPLRHFTTTLELTLQYVCIHNVCHYAPYDVTNMQDKVRSCTVNVHAHTFNCNNQYLILLQVYKPALWTIMLYMMLVICVTSFGVVQLMYKQLRFFTTTLSLTFLYAYKLSFYHYTAYDVTNMHDKFWSVTLNVHFNSVSLSNHYPTLQYVYKPVLWTSMLYTMLAMCTTSFRFVQLMYRPLRQFTTTLGLTLQYVYIHNVHHALCSV